MVDNNPVIKLGGDATGFVRAIRDSEKALSSLSGEIRGFETLAGKALSFAGISLGTAEIINLADAYGQMTGKLKLATQYSGDFAQVQQMLRDSASATRSDLPATVNLYSQLSPALKGIGLSAKESVGLITTINQAINLSGASSEAAQAALVQLGQGFASGALRGEELNSIMEQTPALAQAIADGLGVSRGALRQMGEEGKLTADAVAKALQKVSDQVAEDFGKMPITVGQAFTNLRNEFLVFVGAVDSGAGGTSALAEGINSVANELKEAGPIVTAFTTGLKTLMAGLDGSYRLIKILGVGIAGYGAATVAALSGDLKQAKNILNEMGNDVQAILEKKLVANPFEDNKVIEQTANTTRRRLQLEQQLVDETKKLEQMRAIIAGDALDQIKLKEKENIDARIADQKRLVDAVRAAWQQSLKEAQAASDEAKSLMDKASQKKAATSDKLFNAQVKGLTPEDQAALTTQRAQDMLGQSSYASAMAANESLKGNLKEAERFQKQAEQFLARAETFADKTENYDLMQQVGDAQAALIEQQAKAKQAESERLSRQAADQAALLKDLEAQLDALQKKARELELQVDVTKAESAIKGIKAQLDELKDKTVTLTLNAVGSPEALAAARQSTIPAADLPGLSSGGYTGPGGKYQVAGIVHAGEYVHRQEVVRQPGALAFLARFNQIGMKALAGYADGGLVTRMNLPAVSDPVAAKSSTTLVFDFGKQGRYQAEAQTDSAAEIARVFKRAAMANGRR